MQGRTSGRWSPGAKGGAVLIVLLLVTSAVLLAVGLATRSAVAWFGGGAAFLASFGVDARDRRAGGWRR